MQLGDVRVPGPRALQSISLCTETLGPAAARARAAAGEAGPGVPGRHRRPHAQVRRVGQRPRPHAGRVQGLHHGAAADAAAAKRPHQRVGGKGGGDLVDRGHVQVGVAGGGWGWSGAAGGGQGGSGAVDGVGVGPALAACYSTHPRSTLQRPSLPLPPGAPASRARRPTPRACIQRRAPPPATSSRRHQRSSSTWCPTRRSAPPTRRRSSPARS